MSTSSLSLRIERIDVLTPRIRRLILVDEHRSPLPPFAPGAHIELHVPGERAMRRAYSLVNNGAPDHYEIAVQLEDASTGGSRWIHSLSEGECVLIQPPSNHFPLQAHDTSVLLIAAGIGITPILGMARHLQAQGARFSLHYAGRDATQMAYLQEVRNLPDSHCWISNATASGRMPVREILERAPQDQHLYICGPKRLVSTVFDTAAELGWAHERLHCELFAGSLESADEQPYEAQLRDSGITLQVPVGSSLIDVMIDAGLDPLFDCRSGTCGVCVTQVREGEIEHRDNCLTERERASGSFCACVSRARGKRLVLEL